jgi:hypothetical protein
LVGVRQNGHTAFERVLVVLLDSSFDDVGVERLEGAAKDLGRAAARMDLHPPVPQHDLQLQVGDEEPLVGVPGHGTND